MPPRDKFEPPSDDTAFDIETCLMVLQAIEAAAEQRRGLPVSYASAYLGVALQPGLTVSQYTENLGVANEPTMSRQLLTMGERARDGSPGAKLLDSARASQDFREVNYFLTAKGHELVQKIIKIMRRKR